MATIKILVPDATTNYIENPSLRYDTTGFVAVGATISRSLNRARFGIASLKIVTNGSSLNEGAYYRVSKLLGVSEPITVSVYLRGSGVVRLRLINNPNGKQWVTPSVNLNNRKWTRLFVTGFSTGTNDMRLYVETDKSSAQAVTFYADGFQMERKAYPTTYCDGDRDGCTWSGIYHSSQSLRRGDTRKGGRWVSLCDDPDLYFTTVGGLGVAPIRNNIQSYADAPGSYFQNSKTMDRVVTILFHAKHKIIPSTKEKPSLEKLHELRNMLFEIIQPDKTAGGEEFLVEYQDGPFPMYFRARYDTGLEGEWDVRNQWVNSFPVRFLVVSPYILDDSYEVASLEFRERETINYVAQRYNGAWRTMNGGHNAQIYDFAIGKRGEIYAVGAFTRSNNTTTSIDPQIYSNYISYWDGMQWREVGDGANGVIHSISVGPNGYVYVTGEFTSIGGVAANRAAYWNGSAWNAMSTGLNGIGYAVAAASDGNVYFGGAFTTAGGNNAYYFAVWNGVSWSYGGVEGGLNNIVYTLAVTPDGTQCYVGGAFTDEFGDPGNLSLNYVGLYEISTNQFSDVGDGFDALVRKLALSPSGRLYACGDFTETGSVTPETMLYVAYFNGSAWYPLGTGADATCRNIHVAPDETVLVVGDFQRIGAVDSPYAALWNGATWVALDIELEASSRAVIRDQFGNIYISQNGTLADFASITSVNNVGTVECPPTIYISGPCTLKWIENQTSKKRLYIDLSINANEEVTIEFGTGVIQSNTRANMAYTVQIASDIRSWSLLPGENVLSVFMPSDTGAIMQIGYTPRFWSADSTAMQESL